MYAIKTLNFNPPLPCTHLYAFKYPSHLPFVRTFNAEYYLLLITQNRKAFKTPKFPEVFNFFELLWDIFNDAWQSKYEMKTKTIQREYNE